MATLRLYRVPTTVAYAASGTITLELSPVPFTVTGILALMRTDITTTSATNFNDYWDRVIATLNLNGQVGGQNKTFFGFTNMRLPYHLLRRELGRYCPGRPTVIADSQTNALTGQFAYLIHFGVNPIKPNGEFNWMDLTGGIPPTQKGQLTLGGTFGAAAAPGTNVTVNATSSCFLEIYLYGVKQDAQDSYQDYMPQAFPVWSMATITPTATSTIFQTPYNITSGNFLHTLSLMGTRGSNYPRDRQIYNSLRIYNQIDNRAVIEFGGRAGTGDAGGGDYEIAEIFSQLGTIVRSDNGSTLGVPSIAYNVDPGIVHFRFVDYSNRVHPLYGADLRKITTGNLTLDQGVNNVTTIIVDALYKRYELNLEHPANARWI